MANKRKIFFRADAGQEIGYGHFIRSLALADMLRQDYECTMFTQAPTDYQLREAEGICAVVALPDDDSKFDKFLEYLQGDEIVVLDNYFFNTDYQRAIKIRGCKLVCIDDMHDKHYVADVVINHGCTDKALFDIEPYTYLCLGIDYALLRRPFWNPARDTPRQPNTYTMCFGGSDECNLTYKYAKAILDINPDSHIIAILGDGYQYEATLHTLPNVEIRKRLPADEMAHLFCTNEYVICTASTTCIEALACGAKIFAGWIVGNQHAFYDKCVSLGYIYPLGFLDREANLFGKENHELTPIKFPNIEDNIKKAFITLK